MSTNRAYRLRKKERPQVERKRPRPRLRVERALPRLMAQTGANRVRAHDYVFDACANGQQFKRLTIVDDYTRECLVIDVAGLIRSGSVIDVLSQLMCERRIPKVLRPENGPELASKAILRWALSCGLDGALIDPGKPWQNDTNESFNGKFRDECLSMEWLRNRVEAKVLIEIWRQHYDDVRPHSRLGKQKPAAFGRSCGIAAKPEVIPR